MTEERPIQPLDDASRRKRGSNPPRDGAVRPLPPDQAMERETGEQRPEYSQSLLAPHPVGMLAQPADQEPNVPEPSLPSGAPD